MAPILVDQGCCHRNTVNWLARINKHLFLTVLKVVKSKIMELADSVLGEKAMFLAGCYLPIIASHGGRGQESFLGFLS